MLVSAVSWDLNWFLQLIFTALFVAIGLHTVVKNTASKYFEVDANFEGYHPADRISMPGLLMQDSLCAVCGQSGVRQCSRCKAVRYCSEACQASHWKSGHKTKCKDFHQTNRTSTTQNGASDVGCKASAGCKNLSAIALVPAGGKSLLKFSAGGKSRPMKQLKDVLFPYDEFVGFFSRDTLGFTPCGLLNGGNSCFANAVLQCLSFTRPLVSYLLEKGHSRECSLDDWCFLCEFQIHVERARKSSQAFSPMNILSHLPNIGGTLGYGSQEDAHEFMRFAIDTMQSVCLHEFGGEKAVPHNMQETTLIQHIFGGRLQSQVICSKCDKISNQYENMMDLTVEIQGDVASLEECLDQFTVKESLHGDNMYKCDGCNDYVKAWKRLTIEQAPNILTIALKRFQSGRFGKLNKRINFPETLDLSPYMSEAGDGSNTYKLYAVVVHLDMLNASYFGHYICCIKDFQGNWYRVDDWKVMSVELEEVLSQGAYMLLYSRVSARPSGLRTTESSGKEEQIVNVEMEPSPTGQFAGLSNRETVTTYGSYEALTSDGCQEIKVSGFEDVPLNGISQDVEKECSEYVKVEPHPTGQVAGLSNRETVTTRGSSEVLTSDGCLEIQVSGFEDVPLNGISQDVKKECSEYVEVEPHPTGQVGGLSNQETVTTSGSYEVLTFDCCQEIQVSGFENVTLEGTSQEAKKERFEDVETEPSPTGQVGGLSHRETVTSCGSSEVLTSDSCQEAQVSGFENVSLNGNCQDVKKELSEDVEGIIVESTSDVTNEIISSLGQPSYLPCSQDARDFEGIGMVRSNPCSSVSEETPGEEQEEANTVESGSSSGSLNDIACSCKDSSVSNGYKCTGENSEHAEVIENKSNTTAGDDANYLNGYASAIKSAIPGEDGCAVFSGISAFSTEISFADMNGISRDVKNERPGDVEEIGVESTSDFTNENGCNLVQPFYLPCSQDARDFEGLGMVRANPCSSVLEEKRGGRTRGYQNS